jgi:signal transduction histidine kinase
LEWFTEGFEKRSGIECMLEFSLKSATLGKRVDLPVFRIVQETLNNIFHHAHATEAVIRLTERDGSIVLEISDNGVGNTEDQLSKEDSFGIQGIRERIRALNGEIKIGAALDGGTTIKLHFLRL